MAVPYKWHWLKGQRSTLTLGAYLKYTQQKKLRKSQKTIEQTNTKANNYLIFIYLLRYISSVEKDDSFSLLALLPLLWHCVK